MRKIINEPFSKSLLFFLFASKYILYFTSIVFTYIVGRNQARSANAD